MKIHNRIHDAAKAHRYEIEVTTKDGWNELWSIDANTRAQAASIAKKAGCTVNSVNMVG
jgi:hypothetical protein